MTLIKECTIKELPQVIKEAIKPGYSNIIVEKKGPGLKQLMHILKDGGVPFFQLENGVMLKGVEDVDF